MRLHSFVLAAAIALVVLPLAAPAISATPAPSLVIVSPRDGALANGTLSVTLEYYDPSPGARNVSGQLQIGGEPVALFVRPVGTTIRVDVDVRNLSYGDQALTAFAFTERDAPVHAAPVTIHVNNPPTGSAAAAYAADVLRLSFDFRDDGEILTVSYATPLGNGTVVTDGVATVDVAGYLPPGYYGATIVATDEDGARRQGWSSFLVADRPGTIALSRADHLGGGRARFEGVASDPEGAARLRIGSSSFDLAPDGTFAVEVSVERKLGGRDVPLQLVDARNKTTNASAHVPMEARHVVVYEREVRGIGADAASEIVLVPWLGFAQVRICVEDRCDPNAIFAASSTVEVAWDVGAVDTAAPERICVAAQRSAVCPFQTTGGPMAASWQRAGPAPLSILVEGWTID